MRRTREKSTIRRRSRKRRTSIKRRGARSSKSLPRRKTKARIDPKLPPRNLESKIQRRSQRMRQPQQRRSLLRRRRTNLTLTLILRRLKVKQLLSKKSQRDPQLKPLRARNSKRNSLRVTMPKHQRIQVRRRRKKK